MWWLAGRPHPAGRAGRHRCRCVLLFQYKANRYTGGSGFATYRYPLEALTAAAPVLVLSYTEWVAKRLTAVRIFRPLAIVAVVAQGRSPSSY